MDYEDGYGYARQANMPDEKSGDHLNQWYSFNISQQPIQQM